MCFRLGAIWDTYISTPSRDVLCSITPQDRLYASNMRRFLSRSRSVPLSSQWASSEKSPSPPLVDCPPRCSGQAGSIPSEDAIDERSAMSMLPTPPSDQMTVTTSSCPFPSYAWRDSDSEAKVSQRRSTVDGYLALRPSSCFAVVRRPSNGGYARCRSTSCIVIHDPSLQAALSNVIPVPPGPSSAVEPPEVRRVPLHVIDSI